MPAQLLSSSFDRGSKLRDRDSSKKRKGRPASFQAKKYVVPDDERLASVGSHVTKMVSKYTQCRKCLRKGQEKKTRITCGECDVPLCIETCFSSFYGKLSPLNLIYFMTVNGSFRGGQSEVKPPVFSSQASLVLLYRAAEWMKGLVALAQPEDRTPNLWCGGVMRYHSANQNATLR
ncbi:piggyBac transposable element-derived protein 4 [Trichonephila clavipes]|nr:piggyBac transposable element-derived protein 4 [Trichonephila clavipes]